jgi:hypothetical protein
LAVIHQAATFFPLSTIVVSSKSAVSSPKNSREHPQGGQKSKQKPESFSTTELNQINFVLHNEFRVSENKFAFDSKISI